MGEAGRTRPRVFGDGVSHRLADNDRLAVVRVEIQGRYGDGDGVVPLRHPVVVMEVEEIEPLARPKIVVLPTPFHAGRPHADGLFDVKVQGGRHVMNVGLDVGQAHLVQGRVGPSVVRGLDHPFGLVNDVPSHHARVVGQGRGNRGYGVLQEAGPDGGGGDDVVVKSCFAGGSHSDGHVKTGHREINLHALGIGVVGGGGHVGDPVGGKPGTGTALAGAAPKGRTAEVGEDPPPHRPDPRVVHGVEIALHGGLVVARAEIGPPVVPGVVHSQGPKSAVIHGGNPVGGGGKSLKRKSH